ncbi:response regulator [bacterium]|nr:response regulator [bacterium]
MSKYRIMVVDDDPDIRFVICGLLQLDFEMVQAKSGLDALEKIERYEPDLILLDVRMPVMDGFATLKAIRRHSQFSDTPVFFLTGMTTDDVREQASDMNTEGFVEKPFETQELVEEIRSFFTDHRRVPRLKTFNMRELKRIDSTPLRASRPITIGAGAQDRLKEERARHEEEKRREPTPSPEPPKPKTEESKKRRVFGAGSAEKERRIQPSSGEELEDVAPTKKIKPLLDAERPASPPPRVMPPREEPIPTPKAKEPKKPEPAPRLRPPRPIPAEALKKSASSGQRPRTLCMIDERPELAHFSEGLKGIAEYLPLEDPVEAVEIIARFQPDIVIMRIQGKTYSGVQIASLLQGNARLAHTEVVFISHRNEPESQLRAAQRMTRNPIIPAVTKGDMVHKVVKAITQKPNFEVREKKLSYGVYVDEVLRKAREELEVERREKEKRAYERRAASLAAFMAGELKDYQPPKEVDVGPKEAQEYYM